MPSRDDIKVQVIARIASVVHCPANQIAETNYLWQDLGMGPTVRQAMGMPYTKISQSYKGGLVVSMSDAGKCNTVKDSIDLVTQRANGRNP